ncbi:MAG: agmatinase [Desulfovibrio sp.]|nr:agmatinase [Desulfovibrio sp.]|tara:strand:- start:3306 stop:4100 length:795 start_codon:yes stop_codon:yes gene_type:complete
MHAGIDLIGVPLDENSSYMRGAAAGPAAVVEALRCDSANMWAETGFDLADVLHEKGDLVLPSGEAAIHAIHAAAEEAGKSGNKPLFLGGDHSITYPLVKGLAASVGEFSILHFDAHPDCYHAFEGNRYSHASPFSRIMEDGLCKRLVSVGIRTAHGHQRDQRDTFGIEWLEMKDQQSWPALSFDEPVYISFDLDALDPAFAPGVSHHEPGGMSVREALHIIHSINVPVIGADVVELNPQRDLNGVTGMVAAKLVREIAGMMLKN